MKLIQRFRAVGLTDKDLPNPSFVTQTGTVYLQRLGAKVKEGVRAASGVPLKGHVMKILILAGLFMAGAAVAVDQKISIKGSNTFGEELGPRLIAEYRKLKPDVTITLESKGTTSGFSALLAHDCDIAAASRPVGEDELRKARSRGTELKDYPIGFYAVAVIVNESNPVRALSDLQTRDIFTGSLKNWKDAGGKDAPTQLYIRDPISGAHVGFQELAMESRPYAATAKRLLSYREIAEAVKADKAGIGYVTLNVTGERGIETVSINGVLPSLLSVVGQDYVYARQLHLYTEARRETEPILGFINFVRSRPGQDWLEQTGFVRFAPTLRR